MGKFIDSAASKSQFFGHFLRGQKELCIGVATEFSGGKNAYGRTMDSVLFVDIAQCLRKNRCQMCMHSRSYVGLGP